MCLQWGMVDSNNDPTFVDIAIPANTSNSRRFVSEVFWSFPPNLYWCSVESVLKTLEGTPGWETGKGSKARKLCRFVHLLSFHRQPRQPFNSLLSSSLTVCWTQWLGQVNRVGAPKAVGSDQKGQGARTISGERSGDGASGMAGFPMFSMVSWDSEQLRTHHEFLPLKKRRRSLVLPCCRWCSHSSLPWRSQ